ncbi:hypothetical protein [Candidatus Lokiarchaeum ossiferum]|uniref:hypothetical protein n=1 Tax=Candidatus Lokiarchaeum ossiferum TaxID=2951803 RepID=UPI00352DA3BF
MENLKIKTMEQKLDEISKVHSPVKIGETIFYGSELFLFYNDSSMGTIDELVKDGDLSKEEAEKNKYSSKLWGIHHFQRNSVSSCLMYGYSFREILDQYYNNEISEKNEHKISEIEKKFFQVIEKYQDCEIGILCNPNMFSDYTPAAELIQKIPDLEFISREEKQLSLQNNIFWLFSIIKDSHYNESIDKFVEISEIEIYGSSFESVVNYVHKNMLSIGVKK